MLSIFAQNLPSFGRKSFLPRKGYFLKVSSIEIGKEG
jgi:hypothetical protein